MRWWWLALVLLVTSCSSPASTQLANTRPAPAASEHSDADALVSLALERFLADPKTLPDAGLLPKVGPIYVLREIGDSGAVSQVALPAARRPFVLIALADAQAQADRSNDSVHFIKFDGVSVNGTTAAVTVGVDFVMPKSTSAIKMCCCAGTDTYEKRGGQWAFVRRGLMSCS